jgi:3'-phosphoadenosine 5'-phosphosulfate (PAPS) 3'-phosphatase
MEGLDLDRALSVAVSAARAAGAEIAAAWGRTQSTVTKSSHADLVTETDKKCEHLIRAALLGAFPGHAFIGEEEAAAAGGEVVLTDGPTWMVRRLGKRARARAPATAGAATRLGLGARHARAGQPRAELGILNTPWAAADLHPFPCPPPPLACRSTP